MRHTSFCLLYHFVTSFALTNGFGVLGGVIGPILTGSLRQKTGGYSLPLAVNAALVFAAGVLVVVLQLSSISKTLGLKDDDEGRQAPHVGATDIEIVTTATPMSAGTTAQ